MKGLLFIFIAVIGCTEIQYNRDEIKKNTVQIVRLESYNDGLKSVKKKYDWYTIDECVYGLYSLIPHINTPHYKLVFITKSYGTWVTKYAYEHKPIYGEVISNTRGKKFFFVNIRDQSATLQLVNELRKIMLDEIGVFFHSIRGGSRLLNEVNVVHFCVSNSFKYLTKSEYERWMERYPKTKILKY
jgi:hypothetical protein